jgi:hypothetical protein
MKSHAGVSNLVGLLTRRESATTADPLDYTPRDMGEARELEELFGDQLAVGHSIREATDFLVTYCREGIS